MKTAAELTAEVGVSSLTASGDDVIMTFTDLDRLIDLASAETRETLADKEVQQSGQPHQDLEGGPPGSGGWQAHAEEMQRQRDYFKESLQTIQAHKNGDCWYWQGDGSDHPASMAGSMPVVIRADQLRALIAPVPAQEIVALMPLTNDQIMASVGRHNTSISESLPLRQQWDNVCDLIRKIIAERYSAVAKKEARPTLISDGIPGQGWTLVPLESTPEIMEAAMAVHDKWGWRNFVAMWDAMLNAAQKQRKQDADAQAINRGVAK